MIFGNKNWPIIYVSVCIKRVKGPSLERLKRDKPSKNQGGLFGWRVPYSVGEFLIYTHSITFGSCLRSIPRLELARLEDTYV